MCSPRRSRRGLRCFYDRRGRTKSLTGQHFPTESVPSPRGPTFASNLRNEAPAARRWRRFLLFRSYSGRHAMRTIAFSTVLLSSLVFAVGGCSTVPVTESEREQLEADVERAMKDFTLADPSMEKLLDDAAGYAI